MGFEAAALVAAVDVCLSFPRRKKVPRPDARNCRRLILESLMAMAGSSEHDAIA
jgi:hypothetical protein